jgi:hypothetical protein
MARVSARRAGFDLARGDAIGLERFEAILAESKRVARRRDAVDAALVGFSEFGSDWLQHDAFSLCSRRRFAARTAGFGLLHLLVLGHGVVLHDLALENPDLHAAGAVRS